jgi:voltage-gated potassium channel
VRPTALHRRIPARVLLTGWGVVLVGYVALLVGAFFVAPPSPLDVTSIGVALLILLAVLAAFVALFLRGVRRIPGASAPLVRSVSLLVLFVVPFVLFFAHIYLGLAEASARQIPGIRTHLDALYFTVTMITTVGFGDVSPIGQEARAVATVQMVFNVVVLGFLVRTALQAGHRSGEERPRDTAGPGLPPVDQRWQAAAQDDEKAGRDTG